MSVTGNASLAFNFKDSRVVGVNSSAQDRTAFVNKGYDFTDGVGALQGDRLFQDLRTFSGSTDDLDLSGSLTDSYGTTITLARVKVLYVENVSTANNITIGAASSNQFATILNSTGTLTLKPGGSVLIVAPDASGHAVTAGTGDILRISGTSGQQYKIGIIGATS